MRTSPATRRDERTRVMGRRDLRQVLRIEADSFRYPWSEQDFVEHLEAPSSVALVLEECGLVVGYVVFGVDSQWADLHACVVCQAYRRRGAATRMVANVVRRTADYLLGIRTKVAERNVAAQMFFRHCGFRAVRILPSYLLNDEDAYLMELTPPGRTDVHHSDLDVSGEDLVRLWEIKHCGPGVPLGR
ncbi:MAG: hypothetical protein CMJ58_01410 [Planctomycetaceae bacterium]|nr:hypothetical protein [Planctomycetaceae bacterium]